MLEAAGSTYTKYIRGINLIASANGVQAGAVQNYFMHNAHGDVVQLTNTSGTVTKTYVYDAFGNEKNPAATDKNPWRYCGEYLDLETNTYYLRARYYNPLTSRFTQEDPIRYGLNWYVYCDNNPITFVDPWGLLKIDTISNFTSIMLNDAIVKSDKFVKGLTAVYTALTELPVGGGVSDNLLKLGESIDFWTVKQAIYDDIPILPYDEYLTERGAIYAWARVYHPLSTPTDEYPNGSEWSAWIYRNPKTSRYCFGAEPLPGDRAEARANISPQNPAYKTIGWIHSHPNPGSGYLVDQFSGVPGDGRVTVSRGVPGYLVTPSGVVLRLDPSWPETNIDAIPSTDPNVSVYIENIFRI